MLVRDRRSTVEVCLPAWAREKCDLELWCFDDGSTEFDADWLRKLGADRVVNMHELGIEADRVGSWRIASLIQRALQYILEQRPAERWIYVCDSDTYPTPGARLSMRALEQRGTHALMSLYRSGWQEQQQQQRYRTQRVHSELGRIRLLDRAVAPGCALLIDARALRGLGHPFGITPRAFKAAGSTWDHVLSAELGPVGVCELSLVDHLGRGGLHNPSWKTDAACNPTPELARLRPHLIARIEGPAPGPDRQAGYDPGQYWAQRLEVEGPTYVGAGPARGALQAEAFWRALAVELGLELPRGGAPKLLDFGCGTGRFVRQLVAHGFAYHGADVSPGAVLELLALAARERLAPVVAGPSVLPLGYPAGHFDAIVAVTVLQHVPERLIRETCAELARVLAPEGRIFLIEDANPEGYAPAPHMSFRTAQLYASMLGARTVRLETISAERPGSHYLAVLER